MNLAIVGPSSMTVSPSIGREVRSVVESLEPGDNILIRTPDGERASSGLEEVARSVATSRGLGVLMFAPEGADRSENYHRDYRLVLNADLVVAYFPEAVEVEGGTWHVVHAAMQKGVPCHAYAIGMGGEKVLLGSEEGIEPDWFIDE